MTVTLIRVDNGQPFVAQAEKVVNGDGSTSYQLPNGHYAGQEPNQYGTRNDSDSAGQYQRATENGNLTTFVTREGDLPCAYLIGSGKVYPA